jgi:bifunctional ADP-heptose synthase (sugar kinase/adenylyltransferase)
VIFNVRSLSDLHYVRNALQKEREAGKRLGITTGCFDVFHRYHKLFLERCRRYSDDLVRDEKDPSRPVWTDFVRADMVDG